MKMYYIANARMPTERAHGLQIAKMCEAFIEAGVEVELIVPRRGTVNQSVKEFYGLRREVSMTKLPALDWYGWGRLGYWVSSLSFMAAYFFYFLRRRGSREKGIIYTTDLDQFSWACVPVLVMPYFVELHDAKRYGLLYAFLLRRAKGIIVINHRIKREVMKEFRIPADRLLVHPNGIDMAFFSGAPTRREARDALKIPHDRFVVLYLGKMYSWKGLGIIADVATQVAPDVFFYCVGGTREELKEAIGVRMDMARIICSGHRPYHEVPQWLAAADVLLVLGTRTNAYSYYHTSPMKLFEYMASSRPIISARTPANEEIVSDSEVYFYDPDNAADLARTIKDVRTALDYSAEKTARAYEKANSYTWEKRVRSILNFVAEKL